MPQMARPLQQHGVSLNSCL